MVRALIFVILVLSVTYLEGTNALKCYMCVGSTSSDCASAKSASMVEQSCPVIHLPRYHHRRHQHRRYHHNRDEFDVTTIVNDIVSNSMETTSMPEPEELERQESTTQKYPERVLLPTCMYLKTKATNSTSALVSRGCGYMPPKKDFCTVVEKFSKDIVECKSCDTDNCN